MTVSETSELVQAYVPRRKRREGQHQLRPLPDEDLFKYRTFVETLEATDAVELSQGPLKTELDSFSTGQPEPLRQRLKMPCMP